MSCPILDLFTGFTSCGGAISLFPLRVTAMAIVAIVFGGLIALYPKKVIEIEILFYRLLNWKIEPISMDKEIRNTRIMGLLLFVLGLLSVGYVLWR